MSRNGLRQTTAACIAAVMLICAPVTVMAGEADYEPDDTEEHGAPYFGEAKDVKGLKPLPDVRIKVQVKGTMRFFIVQTDHDGRFRRNGLGPEINPANVEYTCEKGGYKTLGVMTRRMSRDKFAPILIECMLEKT